MFKRTTSYIFFFLVLSTCFLPAQNRKIDSLNRIFPTSHDTMKVYILCSISRFYEANDPQKAIKMADSALGIAKKANYQMGIGGAYGSLGSCLCTAGRYDESINALISAIKIFEAKGAKRNLANNYNGLANAYMGLKNNDKAYEYFLKSYNLSKEIDNKFMIAVAGVGVGNMLMEKGKHKEAIEYYKTSEKVFKDNGVTNYEAMCITMIGETYAKDSNYVEAEKYFVKSLPLFKNSNDEYGLAVNLANLGSVEANRKNYKKAAEYYNQALEINLHRKAMDNIQNSAKGLAEVLELQNKPAEALAAFKIYMQYKDSVVNTERNKAIAEAEGKYENEKKEQQLQVKNLELEKSHIEVTQRNRLIYVFVGAIVVFLVLLFFVYRQFVQKKKANVLLQNKNDEIEKQKNIIEEKNKDITDSINYSKHIQQAIIPSPVKVKQYLPNSFVIFKPKDIVSGDFYLVDEVAGLIYLAVVDCTGHGVPGAMLSVFANSSIKNIITTNYFRDNPAGILSDLCFQFKSNLQSHTTSMTVNDGVDMSICIIDLPNNKLYFSGAKNGLMQLRNSELMEYPAARWGISGSNTGEHLFFHNHIIDLQKGDKFYMSTDGFVDQFGGPKGKKFKQKQLKDLVMNYSNLSFDAQAD
ncbi:MAG: protein serine/threonine phosphatase, partial [Bacteroidetes bacterium]|nr:protein serine/threonine phosphatase [Bacteroidota bacterium]